MPGARLARGQGTPGCTPSASPGRTLVVYVGSEQRRQPALIPASMGPCGQARVSGQGARTAGTLTRDTLDSWGSLGEAASLFQFSIMKTKRMCLQGKGGGTGPWHWNMQGVGICGEQHILAPLLIYSIVLPPL